MSRFWGSPKFHIHWILKQYSYIYIGLFQEKTLPFFFFLIGMLVEKCLNSEEEEFQEISNQFKDIGEDTENGCYEQVFQRIIYRNQLLNSICNHYSTRHNTESAVFDVNLTNSLNIRNLLLYNVLYAIGPIIFSSEKSISWSFFSSSLEI